jgi:methyltransferase
MVKLVYSLLVAVVACQRLLELRMSRRHEAALRARGAVEHARHQVPIMKALHTSWLLACLAEPWLLPWPLEPALALTACAAFACGQTLRLLAMRALGARWTVRVLVLPGAAPVQHGVFRHLRHPNYLGVILELAGLPLIGGAYLTACLFSVANGALLWRRIRAEEHALEGAGEYAAALGDRPCLVPELGCARAELHERREDES